jgi:hypothetical protein
MISAVARNEVWWLWYAMATVPVLRAAGVTHSAASDAHYQYRIVAGFPRRVVTRELHQHGNGPGSTLGIPPCANRTQRKIEPRSKHSRPQEELPGEKTVKIKIKKWLEPGFEPGTSRKSLKILRE